MKQACLLLFLIGTGLHAQWDVPVRVVLDGADAQDRQITGLADPISRDAAVSLDAARHNVMNHAVASGTSALTAALTPALAAYTVGMTLTLVPSEANAAGATLDLNGLGPLPIVRPDGQPVGDGDLPPGIPARLVHAGDRFQLLSTVLRPCPPAFTAAGHGFCIADTAQSALPFYEAVLLCNAQGGRLCSFGEWNWACRRDPAFFDTVFSAEWVDSAANNADNAKVVGYGVMGGPDQTGSGCPYGGTVLHTSARRFRCCTNR